MKTVSFLSVSLWLLVLSNIRESHAQTQKLRFEHITAEQGLPNNTGICMIQDGKGFLWIGTLNGLCKFDGYNFTTYQYDPNSDASLGGNEITGIFEDSDGTIWVIARGSGIFLFDRKTEKFTRFNPKRDSISPHHSSSWAINQDRQGEIWTGNDYDGELLRYNKQTNTVVKYENISGIFEKQQSNFNTDPAIRLSINQPGI